MDFWKFLTYIPGLMASPFDRLDWSRCVVADGGWGTEFQKLGLEPDAAPERWNLEQAELVAQVARSYVEAGAEVILTNTFGGNTFILGRHDLADRLEEVNRRGAEISREAASGRALVFGSMGPTGKLLQTEEVTPEELLDTYGRQSRALWQGGADAILIETMIDVEEMKLAARAAREATPLPLVLSMTFDSGKEKTQTMMGVTPERAVAEMAAAGASMVGANCGLGPETYVRVCQKIRAATPLPIWVKANAGIPQMVETTVLYPQDPETFAGFAVELRKAGANVIGGCCGTTPAHIRQLRARLLPELDRQRA
jgi:methionine synthase I (cobalamin-dependent)